MYRKALYYSTHEFTTQFASSVTLAGLSVTSTIREVSTILEVLRNTESTKRRYGLPEHAMALSRPAEPILVIDSDLGQCGASAV